MNDYAHPEVIVTTDWVNGHLNDPMVKIVEIDVDTKAYDIGHIPGAIGFNWQTQLQDHTQRDIISGEEFEQLLGKSGILPDHTVILYGDNSNWFAAYGFWLFKIYGHEDVRLMDGGRIKWLEENDKPMDNQRRPLTPTQYRITQEDHSLRARLPDIVHVLGTHSCNLVDVRSPDEYTGKVIAPPGMTETAQRGGHIPGADNVPWATAVNQDGTFKSFDQLTTIYLNENGIQNERPTIAYCRIGERSSHTWFVLKYLIGLDDVKNYDGSWTEYGNLVGAAIEK